MEDITDLILGKPKSATPSAGQRTARGESYASTKTPMDDLIASSAQQHGVDPEVFKRLIGSESSFKPDAVSPRGEKFGLGVAQIADLHGLSRDDRLNPNVALPFAAKLFSQYLKESNGDYKEALMRYKGASSAEGRAAMQGPIQDVLSGTPYSSGKPKEVSDPVVDMILGLAPVDLSVSAPTPGLSRFDVVVNPTIEKTVDTRKVGKVKDVAEDKINPILEEILGAGETALTLGTGAISGAVGMPYGIYKGLTSGQFLEGKGAEIAGKEAAGFMERNTYVPRLEAARENLAAIGKAVEPLKLAPTPGGAALASLARAKPNAVPKPKVGPEAVAARIDPALDSIPTPTGKPRVSYADFQAQLEATRAGAPVLPPAQKVQTPTMPAPSITNPYPEVNYAPKGKVNLPEQNARKEILSRVGLENARQSSITGDGRAAANEFQTSKLTAPVGDLYKNTFANERAALENFGQKIVERTGGTLGMDETALYNRGTAITKPFDDFKTVLQTQMKQAYDQAKQVAGGQPAVNPSNIQKFLDTKSNFTVNDSFMALRRGIESHLEESNLIDANGRVSPMTVEQAENLRKYVNSNWSNERSGVIGRFKDNIDNDVTLVAGKDVYKNARDIRTKIARLLDDPKGVAKIMDYDPRSPMNRAVPFEKIAGTVENMSVDQQRHLFKLLKDMPPELRPQADAAIAEIRAQFANRILQEASKNKDQWNAAGVTKYLNQNNRKLGVLMEDKELAQMVKDLHDAGHILKYDSKYPGAAVQASNLIKMGAIPVMTGLGGTVGGALGLNFGDPMFATITAPAGAAYGAKKGQAMAEKSALKRVQRKMVPIKDIGKGN